MADPNISTGTNSPLSEKKGATDDDVQEWSDPERMPEERRESLKNDTTVKLRNPLAILTKAELFRDVEQFAMEKDLMHIVDDLKKGALISQNPKGFEGIEELSEEEKESIRHERTHRWDQTFMMYFMTSKWLSALKVVVCLP